MSNYERKTLNEVWAVIEKDTGVQVDTAYRSNYVDTWREWFGGSVTGFHNYTEKVMGTMKNFTRKSLGAGGKACNAWADILTREFPTIALDNDKLAERVEAVLTDTDNNFKEQFVRYLELGFGVGTSAIVEYIVEDKVMIDFLDINEFVPLSWRNGNIKELATINFWTDSDRYYTHIQYHRRNGVNYVIDNKVFVSDDENEIGVQLPDEAVAEIMEPSVTITNAEPFFQIIKPNITNKINIDSPLGMSIYQDARDTLKAIDSKYTEFDNEFCLGKKRIVVSSDALKKELDTDSGQFVSYLGSDSVYQAVNRSGDEPLFEAIDMTLREQSYINGLNQEFKFLADAIGMSSGTFMFDGVSMKTATEVISERSKTFGNKQKHDKMIKNVLTGVVKSIIMALSVIDNVRHNAEVTITCSDNVLIDDQAKKADERLDVQSGVMPKTTYLMRNYGLSEEDANEWIQKATAENGFVGSETIENMFTPTEGV